MKHVILLGDSIFDNAIYVPGYPSVIKQLQNQLSSEWKATLLAIDGNVTEDVLSQTARMPEDATHMVISCGGNDALGYIGMLNDPANSVSEVLQRFADIRSKFQTAYEQMLSHVLSLSLSTAVCTIYDSIPDLGQDAAAALSFFNDVILREAFTMNVLVIDLRLTVTDISDYSEISPIEPSVTGGEKIVQAISQLLSNHDFKFKHSAAYF